LKIENPRSLFVIKPSSLGDVVHTLPSVRLLRGAFPDAQISWVVNTEWAPLLDGNPDIDRVLIFPRGEFRGLGGMARLARWIASLDWPRPDLALDFQGLTRSALLARLARARRVHCLGDAEWLPRFLASRVVPAKRDTHAVDRYLKLVADLGIAIDRPLEFPLPLGKCPAGFNATEPFILLHPFSRGAGKSIAPAVLGELCAALRPLRIVLAGRTGGDDDAPAHCANLLNRTSLTELVWLCRRARFVVSVDSGPMHIAAAVTNRLLGIHTWSDPRIVGPYRRDAWVWKGGRILRVADVTPELAVRMDSFDTAHVPAVADLVRSAM
jgi:ADP-heptose:LPS heptosyltransferase